MIAANNYWCFNFAFFNQIVDQIGKSRSFAISKPADSGRQTLELNPLVGQFYPAAKRFIVFKFLQD